MTGITVTRGQFRGSTTTLWIKTHFERKKFLTIKTIILKIKKQGLNFEKMTHLRF